MKQMGVGDELGDELELHQQEEKREDTFGPTVSWLWTAVRSGAVKTVTAPRATMHELVDCVSDGAVSATESVKAAVADPSGALAVSKHRLQSGLAQTSRLAGDALELHVGASERLPEAVSNLSKRAGHNLAHKGDELRPGTPPRMRRK